MSTITSVKAYKRSLVLSRRKEREYRDVEGASRNQANTLNFEPRRDEPRSCERGSLAVHCTAILLWHVGEAPLSLHLAFLADTCQSVDVRMRMHVRISKAPRLYM